MIPRLDTHASIDSTTLDYLSQLEQQGFSGDIEKSYSSRLAVATDNSVYQQLPSAVLLPKTTHDISLITALANTPNYEGVRFSARGGGTGTNGQSLTSGIIVDLSRYMNKVLEINAEEGWVRVQTGVIKDQLNDAVRDAGYFFSPDLSTSNRATIGGMINTDASGQGSLKYGKTSDHVLSLRAVFADGSVYETDGSQGAPKQHSFAEKAMHVSEAVCRDNRDLICEKFPPLNRFLTGYDLKNALTEEDQFDLTRILCGAEGSLAILSEAKLNLTRIPKKRVLINVKYDSFDSALRNAPFMVNAKALSVETIDSKVLNLAKQDIVWNTVSELITDVPNAEMKGINMVEFAGNSSDEVEGDVKRLLKQLQTKLEQGEDSIIGYQVCDNVTEIGKIYNMRKKAVGLLGATKGAAKPVAFAEDTCVPPEHLADFIAEFRTLLDTHGLYYGMFGHVDAGVLHVRPALDICDPEQEKLMHHLSDEVVKLVSKYGGLMWGEHGKGFRSEYGPEFFGAELFEQLRRVKTAFDPQNKMNPGKICTPVNSNEGLVKVSDVKRGYFDRQIPVNVRDSFSQALECNGNGLCFNYDTASPMCPSMKVTYDRKHSPKGRAGLVREWLRQLEEQGVDILDVETQTLGKSTPVKTMIDRVRNSLNKRHQKDFSHEVYDAMNGCLACKACASQCPIKVDVPSFRSRFLNLYHTRYQRPAKDYLVANIETMLPLMATAPKLINGVLSSRWVNQLIASTIGYVDTPHMTYPTLSARLSVLQLPTFDMQTLANLNEMQKTKHVLVVQDPFTSYYDGQVVEAFVELAIKLGITPVMVPFKPNGKAQHIKGFLKQFSNTARTTGEFLAEVASLQIPMVGVDPALVLCYRDEYSEVEGSNHEHFEVLTAHEWLLPLLQSGDVTAPKAEGCNQPWYLLAHCTEKTKLPNAEKEWGTIFKHFNACFESVPVGCCGMAGTFGHEQDKLQMSRDIYDLSWGPVLNSHPTERVMATGYSCRSQTKRFSNVKPLHPVEVLNSLS
jgi:FAD/FMN-containing dehydrogenase/Fe-S oxidoreductase